MEILQPNSNVMLSMDLMFMNVIYFVFSVNKNGIHNIIVYINNKAKKRLGQSKN